MIPKTPLRLLSLGSALASFILAGQALAIDYYWDSNGNTAGFGNTNGTWGASPFWSTSSAGTATPSLVATTSGDTVIFGGTTTSLNYGNGAIAIAPGGVTTNSITYSAGQTTAINLGTTPNTITLAGTTPTITVNHPGAVQTISSPVAGSTGLIKAGVGVLTLSGANTYTGGSTVNAGTLVFRTLASKAATGTHAFAAATTLGLGIGGGNFTTTDVDNALAGTMTGNLSNVTVSPTTSIGIDTTAATLAYSTSIGAVSRGLAKFGTNTLTLSGTNAYTGVTTVGGGTLSVSSLANAGSNSNIGAFATAGATGLVLQGGGTLNYTGPSTTTDRGFTTTGTGGGIGNTINIPAGVSLSMGDSFKNDTTNGGIGGLNITSGVGASLTLSSMTITSGFDFNVTAANTNFTIQTVNLSGSDIVLANRGTGMINVGTIVGFVSGASWLVNIQVTGTMNNYSGLLYLGGNVTLTGSSTFNSQVITQGNGVYSFNSIKNVNGGASSLGNPTSAAIGTINLNNQGGTLRYIGTGDTTNREINVIAGGTTGQLEQAGTGLLKFTSAITSGNGTKNFVLKGSTAGTGELAGAITDGAGGVLSLTKQGSGTWTLSGANTYTGTTTITGGTLALGANNTLPNSSAVSIGAAAILNAATFSDTAGTLAVTGAATINLGSGGTLAFADSSAVAWPGTLNITGTFTSSSVRFGTSAAALTTAQQDKITVNGTGLGDYELNAGGYVVFAGGPPDTTPPTPSPMTWASVPAATGTNSITMTATTATDASGVQYYFDETSGNPGGADSGWQSSPTYTNTGLNASTTYTYTVTARDLSAAQNATAASAAASATTNAPPIYTVWNVQLASSSANQITTAENFIGAATENTTNSTWNRVASLPQTGMVLKKSDGVNTGVTLDFSGGTIGTQNLLNGPKIFNSRVGGGTTSTMTLKGLTIANSYDIVMYSDWWWKGGDSLPITQTAGTGLVGTFHLNRVNSGTNGEVLAFGQDTNPADVTSGAGNTGNWMRVNGLTPTLAGELAFRLTDGNNTPFNGFQLISTPIPPRADIFSMSLASNPPSIREAVISGTNITLTVPYGTNVTNLAPTFVLWPGATCPIASGTARNFTTPQTYTVTSSDSLVVKNYIVTVVIAPPLPEFTLTAPATWDGRSTITVTPSISNLTLLQANNGTNFTYDWSTANVAVTSQITPGVLTLTRSQGSGFLTVSLTLTNGTEPVTRSTSITVQEPATDPWVERTPLANEKPIANQFFARNPFTNLGTIYYRGTQSGSPDTVFVKIYQTPSGGSESLFATHRQPLASGAYDFTATIPAGLFTYRVVYGTTTAGTDTNITTVNNLLCGDAYIIEGQSNAQATDNSEPQVDTSDPWIKTYDLSLGWGPAYAKPTSPNWGSKIGFWGMKLGQRIIADHQMPVCFINGAVGGTFIIQHQPNPVNRTQAGSSYSIYANLLNRVIGARLTHGIRGIFWHQGESDCSTFGPILDPDYTTYQQNFLSMTSAWKQDFPNFQRYILWQVMPNACSIGPYGDELRDVQRKLPSLYSKMSILNTLGLSGYEGCHFSKIGYENMGNRIAAVVARDFYGVGTGSHVTAPLVKRVYFTSSARTAITVEFDQPMSWSSFSLPNWHVNDVANLVTSGSASGNSITLQLSGAAAANSTLTYLKDEWNHTEGVSTLLYGANTIPAVSFASEPISALSPYQSWTNSKNLNGLAAAGDADPDFDGLKNALEFVLGGEPNPSSPNANSTALLPTSTRNTNGDLIFTFKRKIESTGNVGLSFQWSADLSFPPLNTLSIGATSSSFDGITVSISSFDSATETIIVTVPASKAVNGRLFGKLRAIAP
jgi:autotransporter-associated beta strand protein